VKDISKLKLRPTGEKENPEYVKYGTKDGQIEFGHLHLGTDGDLKSDVTSGVMLQAYDSRHYMTMDIDGVRKGWTINRSPGPTQTICATDDAGIVGNEKGIGFFLLSENGDIVIRAPKGRIRMSALDIDIRADGQDNTRGTINLDSNQSVNVKTGTFDVQANVGARIFTPKTLNLVANTSLHLAANFVNAFSAASSTLPNKAFSLSTVEFNTKSLYV
jgi:hypothetical protein